MKPSYTTRISLPLAVFVVSLALTARASDSSSAVLAHSGRIAQHKPGITQVPMRPLGPNDIIYDNGGPNQIAGNEMTEWIQAEDFVLSADATLTSMFFWDIEDAGGGLYQGEIDWQIYSDNGGQPGTVLASGAATDVTRNFIQGGVAGSYDEYSNTFRVSPGVALTAGTRYWLGLHNGPYSVHTRFNFYWETTNSNGTLTAQEDEFPFDGFWTDVAAEHAFYLSSGEGIVLTGRVRRQGGNRFVELTWSPADGGNVNVLRDGAVIGATDDDGSFQQNIHSHTGTDTYQVCETDSGDCSNTVSVTVR